MEHTQELTESNVEQPKPIESGVKPVEQIVATVQAVPTRDETEAFKLDVELPSAQTVQSGPEHAKAMPEHKTSELHPGFMHPHYEFDKKLFTILGDQFNITDGSKTVLYSRQKPFRIREDYRMYADKDSKEEILRIKTPNFIKEWSSFGVTDPKTGEMVGTVKRRYLTSIFRDEWVIADKDGQEIGKLQEKSFQHAYAKRMLGSFWAPGEYEIVDNKGDVQAKIQEKRHLFKTKFGMDVPAKDPTIDRRLIVATGILLGGVEKDIENNIHITVGDRSNYSSA
jgi:uncharacterized protein YxjI